MDLTTPTAHADGYIWLVVLMAHAGIGLALVAVLAAVLDALARDWVDGAGGVAWVIVVLCYGIVWEGIVQEYGAGMPDAFVDTFAVAMGGLIGLSAWARRGACLAGALFLFAAVAVAGVRSRK